MITPDLTVHSAALQAIELEKFANRYTFTPKQTSRTYTPRNANTTVVPRKDTQPLGQKTGTARGEPPTNPKDIVCFKCNGRGHYKRDCPNARAFTMREWNEIRQDTKPKKLLVSRNGQEEEVYPPNLSDDDGTYIEGKDGTLQRFEGDSEEGEEEEEQLSLIFRRSFHSTPRVRKSDQRENIFQTKCKVQGKVCDLIIDSGSESNCVSKQLITDLNLDTTPHSHPYKMKWLDSKTSGSVTKQCLVSLTLGTYTDEVLCDVLEMDACHILLGRPWQYDRRTQHNGYTNTYTLKHEGKKKELVPLPPHRSVPPKPAKSPIHLINRRECDKEIKRQEELYLLFTKEVSPPTAIPSELRDLIAQYQDVFPTDLPPGLPPVRGIEHQIDLVPGASLPNKPAYRTNPLETKNYRDR